MKAPWQAEGIKKVMSTFMCTYTTGNHAVHRPAIMFAAADRRIPFNLYRIRTI